MNFVSNRSTLSSVCLCLAAFAGVARSPVCQFVHAQDAVKTDQYFLGPDSKPQDGVPKGKLSATTITSKVYPDVTFKYQV